MEFEYTNEYEQLRDQMVEIQAIPEDSKESISNKSESMGILNGEADGEING